MKYLLLTMLVLANHAHSAVSKIEMEHLKNRVHELYGPLAQDKGYSLDIVYEYDNKLPGAYARKIIPEKKWNITVNGDFLNHPEMTYETFALVLCHEVGHFLGGAPFVQGKRLTAAVFQTAPKHMSNEGQADFFATADCGKKIFGDNYFSKKSRDLPDVIKNKCEFSITDRETCLRLAENSKKVVDVYGEIASKFDRVTYPKVSYTEKENFLTERTLDIVGEYATLQCRMDTMMAGIECDYNLNGECINRFGKVEEMRPRCWYHY